ncbi:MAG: hypothetical protein AABX11_03365 [Nanoarchaeota archaeon]
MSYSVELNPKEVRRKFNIASITLVGSFLLGGGLLSSIAPSFSELVRETRTAYKSEGSSNYNMARVKLEGANFVRPLEYQRPLSSFESNRVNKAEIPFYHSPFRFSLSL